MSLTSAVLDNRAGYLAPRRVMTLERARRRSVAVKLARLGLAAAMLAIAGAVAFQTISYSLQNPDDAETGPLEARTVRMINPRFTGRDAAGAPYEIVARAAVRRLEDLNASELEAPALTFQDPAGGPPTIVDAVDGVFLREEAALDLSGGVRFESGSGYRFETERARVYLRENRVVGDAAVSGEGPMGAIESQSFEILDGGARILFGGGVVSRIEQPRRPASEGDAAEAPGSGDETLDEDE